MIAATETDICRRVGMRVRMLRKKWTGLSQENFAVHCELGKQTIINVEHGRHSTNLRTLEAIAGGLGCSVAFLVGEDEF